MFAYYDPDANIAWLPTGESDDVVSERTHHGLHDFDRASHKLVAMRSGTRAPACPRASSERCQDRGRRPLGRRFRIGTVTDYDF